MPELLEVEYYRRLAERGLERPVAAVDAPDDWILKRGLTARAAGDALVGRRFVAARRIGKLLLLDTDGGPVLGVRFGMTGRLFVDGSDVIQQLVYGSTRDVSVWDRFTIHFADGGDLRLRDPRRLGGIELDPDEARLGVDALVARPADLRVVLGRSTAPLKARLMDQLRIAGLGNLLVDEILWRAALDPARPAGSLTDAEQRRLHRHLRATLVQLLEQGGSHTGDLQDARFRGGSCPRDGAELLRRRIGGRTTYSCPVHQR